MEKLSKEIIDLLNIKLLGERFVAFDHKGKPVTMIKYEDKYYFESSIQPERSKREDNVIHCESCECDCNCGDSYRPHNHICKVSQRRN